MITRNDFFRYIETTPAIIGIRTRLPAAEMVAKVNDAIAAKTGQQYHVYASEDYINIDLGDVMSAARAVSAVPFFTLLLALFGLVNNQLVSFQQKKMLYAVLYSTAMSRRQLGITIFTELLSSAMVGGIAAIGMSFWLTKIMRDIIFVTISYVPLVITAGQVLQSLALLALVLCITAISPLRQLRNMDIIKEIKYE